MQCRSWEVVRGSQSTTTSALYSEVFSTSLKHCVQHFNDPLLYSLFNSFQHVILKHVAGGFHIPMHKYTNMQTLYMNYSE
jgi:hypothetical protein